MNNWASNLVQGEWFETHVAKKWLQNHRPEWWLTDSRNHVRFGGKGPRLTKGAQELVIPDFRLDNPDTGESGWLDAKMKSKPFSLHAYQGEKFYSIDPKTYRDYSKICSIFKHMQFEILLGCCYTNLLYIFDLKKCQPVIHSFENQFVRYGRNETPCFSTAQMKVIGRWDSSLLPK